MLTLGRTVPSLILPPKQDSKLRSQPTLTRLVTIPSMLRSVASVLLASKPTAAVLAAVAVVVSKVALALAVATSAVRRVAVEASLLVAVAT
jgi:hypothetical protein